MNQYILTKMNGAVFSFLLHDQRTVEIHCDPAAGTSLLGSIYIGKIKNIAKNIGAAFVEIAPGTVCHLPLDDMKAPVYTKKGASKLPQAGDELLVQVSREGIKTKYPSVTTNLTLHGKYVLLTSGNTAISVSSKLPKERREELRAFAEEWEAASEKPQLSVAPEQNEGDGITGRTGSRNDTSVGGQGDDEAAVITGWTGGQNDASVRNQGGDAAGTHKNAAGRTVCPYGWLFRTNAGSADRKTLGAELSLLKAQYETLLAQVPFRTCFSCLHRTPAAYVSRLSDLYESDAERIVTDDETLYQEIHAYLSARQPEDISKLTFYKEEMQSLKKRYSLEHRLEQALQPRVWLGSGGYLVIEPTEALTVIDVNSGKSEGGKKREAAFLKLNCEAASEIARQLRLRNISGIILVDFINMERPESNDALLMHFKEELRKDPIPASLIDMTKLSLVELTRRKKEKSLAQSCRELNSIQ